MAGRDLPVRMEDLPVGKVHTRDYLERIGVPAIPPSTCPFDPGYDPATFEAHLLQSSHLMETMKISMACWQICNEQVTRWKVAVCTHHGVPTVSGGGPFEVAVQQGQLPLFLDLVADIGMTRVEAGEGFTDMAVPPRDVLRMATERGLQVQFELGKKHDGAFTTDVVSGLIEQGDRWLEAGAAQVVIEARESAQGVGLFDETGRLDVAYAERFVEAFGMETCVFEAPTKPSQFALLNHFGRSVHLCNVRLEELLRVEIYRRGLHSDAFEHDNLRPTAPPS
ncbi:MAG TPA: phosphosulfolactate synthase [Candidatus Limnocylindrales bacterium]|nr:phosphosulfolactate synthase [Candidatus Limnocylindrales bacterium]